MKCTSSPLISVVNWGTALSLASHFFQSYSVPQYRARFCIVRSGTPSDESGTHSRSGHLVALMRRRRSVRSASAALKRNGRISVPSLPVGCATSVRACVMALTLLEKPKSPSGPTATVAAATPTKRRRSTSGGFDMSCLLSPSGTRSRTAGQNPARHHDPHQADDGPDEPRIGAVRGPESTAQPRGAAQHSEHDGCDARPEQRVRDQPGPPESERPGHNQHRARERAQHDQGPHEVIQSRCDRLISGAGDRVREGCAYREEDEKQSSDRCARGGRRRAPTVLSRIR